MVLPSKMDPLDEEIRRQAEKGNKMNKASPAAPINASKTSLKPFASLGRQIVSRLGELAPTADSSARADRCMRSLHLMMEWLGPQWEIQAFGSFANGFGTVLSDIDVTCCNRALGQEDVQKEAASDLRMLILPMLREHGSFSVVEEIFGARVPILKLRFENVLDVDLSCHNRRPLANTGLLRAYSHMDTRIKALGITVKFWAKESGVCDASKSNLSSYSFTLLMIYFLQVHADTQLPILPVDAFEEGGQQESDERVVAAMWQCGLSLGELVARFFAFYSCQEPNGFVWGKEVASIRWGRRSSAKHAMFSELRGRQACRVHIEDPYQLERNLHGVLGEFEEEQLQTAFRDTWLDIRSNKVPAALSSKYGHYESWGSASAYDAIPRVSPFLANDAVPAGPVAELQESSLEGWLMKPASNQEEKLSAEDGQMPAELPDATCRSRLPRCRRSKRSLLLAAQNDQMSAEAATSSSTNSTKSGGNSPGTSSGDESFTESVGEAITSVGG